MPKFVGVIIGAVAITFAVLIDIGTFGALTPVLIALAGALLTAGAGMVLTGVGTLISGAAGGSQSQSGGIAWAVRNPIKSWDIIYGRVCTGGTVVFLNEFGDSDKYLDMVIVLAAHVCQSLDRLLFDKQFVQLQDNGGGTYDSFSPVQQTINIQHISRANNVVTVTLGADIPLLQVGDLIKIQNVSGDYTLNGRYPVSQIVSQVYVPGTPGSLVFQYICGGNPAIVDNEGQCLTAWPDYGRKVHMEVMLGTQALGTTFTGMINGTPNDGDTTDLITPSLSGDAQPWTANCSLVGKTCVFLRLHFDATVFSGGLPAISFLLHGKNDIYDPRTSPVTYAYTENAALIIADYLSNTTWGFKAAYGTEIPLAPLIAEANICDEDVPLAAGGATVYEAGTISTTNGSTVVTGSGTAWTSDMAGGALIVGGYIGTILSASGTGLILRTGFAGSTASGIGYAIAYGAGIEPRYAANGAFDLSRRRGEILQNLLTACAGRISYSGGQFILQTGAWRGSSPAPAPGIGSMAGAFRWKPAFQIRDLYNGVRGTYICPANNWHPGDVPPYAQDSMHGYSGPIGYGGDSNLAADGGDRRWLDMQLPFTISSATAQRLCKIELLRRRHQGTGTFRYNMVGYQFAALDVVSMTLPLFGWTNKLLEIAAHRFVLGKQQIPGGEEVTVLSTEIDVQETDSSIYDWSTTEELTAQGYQQATMPNPFTPAPPTGLTIISDTQTAVLTPSGLADAILVSWVPPADGYVINGGHIEVQYQEQLSYLAGTVAATNGSANVTGTGTAWTDEMEGGSFVIGGITYTIKTVTSATALILTVLFAGSTASGLAYAISYPGPWIGLPSVNASVTQIVINGVDDGAQYTVQVRAVNAGGFPSSWVSGTVTAKGASLPLPWRPYGEPYPWAKSGYTFAAQVGPVAPTSLLFGSFGSTVGAGMIAISGSPPVNAESATAAAPGIDAFAAVTAHSLNTLPVGAGIAQVFPIDSAGKYGPGSNFSEFNVPTAASRVSIGVAWGAATVGYEVFVGADINSTVGLGAQAGTPGTINIDSFAGTYGPPDLRAVTALVRGKQVIHGGIGITVVISATSTTAVVGMLSAPVANEFVGRYLIRVNKGSAFGGGFGWSILGPITASDTGSPNCTLTLPTGPGLTTELGAGDLVLISMLSDTNTGTSIGDSGLASPFAPSGLGVNAEAGEVVRILLDPTGAATGATATVVSNTGTVASTSQFRLPDGMAVTPGAGSVFIFEAATWACSNSTSVADNSIAPTALAPGAMPLVTLACSALAGTVALVQVLLQDADGNLSDETTDTIRMLYVTPTGSSGLPAAAYAVPVVAGTATPDASQGANLLVLTAAICLTDANGNKYVNVARPINYSVAPGTFTPWQLITQEDPVGGTGGYSTIFDPSYVLGFAVASANSPKNTQCHVDFRTSSAGITTPSGSLIDQPIS